MRHPICIFEPGVATFDALLELKELFTNDILDCEVLVLCVAGRSRQGEDSLLNFILRYLRAKGTPDGVQNDVRDALQEINWECETESQPKTHNQRILVWPEIFKVRDAHGEEIVVVLVETQGSLEYNSKTKNCAPVPSLFLSLLLSSIHIFDVEERIQGDESVPLRMFTDFASLICSEESQEQSEISQKPFQDLIFLVRNRLEAAEAPYGWDGGSKVLKDQLRDEIVEGESAAPCVSVRDCFESTRCYLMAQPARGVTSPSVLRDGNSDDKSDFVEHLENFVEDIFRPCSLRGRNICGTHLTVREFHDIVGRYVREMHGKQEPSLYTLYEASVNATNSLVVNRCFNLYQARLSELIREDPQGRARFEKRHDLVLTEVSNYFKQFKKMGDKMAIAAASYDLRERIASAKEQFEFANTAAFEKECLYEQIQHLSDMQNHLKKRNEALVDENAKLKNELNIVPYKVIGEIEEPELPQRGIRRTVGGLAGLELLDLFKYCTIS